MLRTPIRSLNRGVDDTQSILGAQHRPLCRHKTVEESKNILGCGINSTILSSSESKHDTVSFGCLISESRDLKYNTQTDS